MPGNPHGIQTMTIMETLPAEPGTAVNRALTAWKASTQKRKNPLPLPEAGFYYCIWWVV